MDLAGLLLPLEFPQQAYDGSRRALDAMAFDDNTHRRIMHTWYWLATLDGKLDAVEGDVEALTS